MSVPISLSTAQRLFAMPVSSNSRGQSKDLTDASSALTVVAGGYEIFLETASTEGAYGRIGGAAAVPVSAAAENTSFHIPPGTPVSVLVAPNDTLTLNAIMITAAQTGKLRVTRLY